MRFALYQPDIPQNTGGMIRLAVCLGLGLDIIGPCGFVYNEAKMRRVGLDYTERSRAKLHTSWTTFLHKHVSQKRRLILLTTQATTHYCEVRFQPTDTLLLGRESCGVPDEVRSQVDTHICVPMAEGDVLLTSSRLPPWLLARPCVRMTYFLPDLENMETV